MTYHIYFLFSWMLCKSCKKFRTVKIISYHSTLDDFNIYFDSKLLLKWTIRTVCGIRYGLRCFGLPFDDPFYESRTVDPFFWVKNLRLEVLHGNSSIYLGTVQFTLTPSLGNCWIFLLVLFCFQSFYCHRYNFFILVEGGGTLLPSSKTHKDYFYWEC